MYHSITIGDKNTWTDWHLIPATRPLVNPPSVKTSYVDIPGGDGSLDLTEALTGKPLYSDRTGSWDFYVDNDHEPWQELYSKIMLYLHGKTMRAVLEDDSSYYYEGRFSVNQWRSNKSHSMITISYVLEPYKYYSQYGNRWKWDPFNFNTDTIQEYKNVYINGNAKTITMNVEESTIDIHPVIKGAAVKLARKDPQDPNKILGYNDVFTVKVTFNGTTYTLKKGTNVMDDITFVEGDNVLTFTGLGKISIQYIGGMF